jgi:hypothetical protein
MFGRFCFFMARNEGFIWLVSLLLLKCGFLSLVSCYGDFVQIEYIIIFIKNSYRPY